jgi:hypothetical protein
MSTYTLEQAAAKLGIVPHYARKCVHEGKLKASMSTVPGTRIPRLEITEEAIAEFDAREKKQVGKREDGRNKYVWYGLPAELEAAQAVLQEAGLMPLQKANPPKHS